MPLWRVTHPAGAYSDEDRKGFAENITAVYSAIPIPKFYVVSIFNEAQRGDLYVGGELHDSFVRIEIEHMARTLEGPVLRRWWVSLVERLIAPYVQERGYEWEVTINEAPADLWMIQGEVPPPFESVAEKRWVRENKPTPYGLDEMVPNNLILTPGVGTS